MAKPPIHYPDGLGDLEAKSASGGFRRHASPVSLLVLAAILALALSGLLGGNGPTRRMAQSPEAALTVEMPRSLRNGEFFEMMVEVEARSDLAKPAIAVDPSLWRQLTINTQTPAPKEERFEGGAYRYEFDAVKAGGRLVMKVDGQVNPPLMLGTRGAVTLYDGDRAVARLPLSLRVWP